MFGKSITEIQEDKDRGLIVSNDLKSTKQSYSRSETTLLGFKASNFYYGASDTIIKPV